MEKKDDMYNNEEDDILTLEEEHKINDLRNNILNTNELKLCSVGIFGSLIQLPTAGLFSSNVEPPQFSFIRRIGLNPVVTVNNISGKKAWIILSPAPIVGVSSVGVEKLGQISFSSSGDYKCQQSSLSNNTSREFELDNSQIYYSVFFDCDGKWKTPYKNRKINTRKYNINLLERHVNDAIDAEFIPIN